MAGLTFRFQSDWKSGLALSITLYVQYRACHVTANMTGSAVKNQRLRQRKSSLWGTCADRRCRKKCVRICEFVCLCVHVHTPLVKFWPWHNGGNFCHTVSSYSMIVYILVIGGQRKIVAILGILWGSRAWWRPLSTIHIVLALAYWRKCLSYCGPPTWLWSSLV